MTAVEPRAAKTSVSDQPRLQRRPRANTETWLWYFMRISGLALLFLALLHFFLTHILHDVTATNADFVAGRWQNPIWRTYDWLLLALGLLHGVAGLRHILDDYIRVPWKRAAVKAFVYVTTSVLFVYGTVTIVTFSS